MKQAAAVLAVLALVVALSATGLALAAEMQKGTITGVDLKAGTISFCPEGTSEDLTLKADTGVDLSKVKPDMKAQITRDKDRVTEIKEMKKPRAAVGC